MLKVIESLKKACFSQKLYFNFDSKTLIIWFKVDWEHWFTLFPHGMDMEYSKILITFFPQNLIISLAPFVHT